jgi:hypothetical protein
MYKPDLFNRFIQRTKMRSSCCLLILITVAIVDAYIPESTLATDIEAAKSLVNLVDALDSGQLKLHLNTRDVKQECSSSILVARRE